MADFTPRCPITCLKKRFATTGGFVWRKKYGPVSSQRQGPIKRSICKKQNLNLLDRRYATIGRLGRVHVDAVGILCYRLALRLVY